ncbi:MAG: hypothetical protein IJ124_03255, partial [Clostridia bacterium]|nr:hypothetical protein [Clostridia bacterium]
MRKAWLNLLAVLTACALLMCGALAEAPTETVEPAEVQPEFAEQVEEAVPEVEEFVLAGEEEEELPVGDAGEAWLHDTEAFIDLPERPVAPMAEADDDPVPEYEYSNGCSHRYVDWDVDYYVRNGRCVKCGYECPHPQEFIETYVHQDGEFIDTGSDNTHLTKYIIKRTTDCFICGMIIQEDVLDTGEYEEEHWYDTPFFSADDGCWIKKCRQCKHQVRSDCQHVNTYLEHDKEAYYSYKVNGYDTAIGESVGQQGHMITGYTDESVICSDCGAVLETRQCVGPISFVGEHRFRDG